VQFLCSGASAGAVGQNDVRRASGVQHLLNGVDHDETACVIAPRVFEDRAGLRVGGVIPPPGLAEDRGPVVAADGRPEVVVGGVATREGGIFSLFEP